MMFHHQAISAPVARHLRILKMIAIALVMGVATFGTIVALMSPMTGAPAESGLLDMLRLVCLGLFIPGVVVPIVYHKATISKLRALEFSPDEESLAKAFTMTTIIGLAMMEGPALLACVIALLSHNPLDLLLGLPPLLLMLWRFPSESRWRSFVEHVRETVN